MENKNVFILLDGKEASKRIKSEIATNLSIYKNKLFEQMKQTSSYPDYLDELPKPCLAVVSVGSNPASTVYVRGKIKDCEECGFTCLHISLSEQATYRDIKNQLIDLSEDSNVHGIILQLPLPEKFNKAEEYDLIQFINRDKDVDCFTNYNIGRLYHGDYMFAPCTPAGIIDLLMRENMIDIDGKDVCIVNRSEIVGKPLALMMMQMGATVTVCHTHTKDIDEKMGKADILVVAVGKENFINKDNVNDRVKNGAAVIDVGINRNSEGKVIGDCDLEAVRNRALYVSPVPGGVGLMTRAMLMKNVFKAYQLQMNIRYLNKFSIDFI